MNFANNLHYLRKRDKVTQEDLAERLGVSRQSVSKWETGEAYPETDKLIALCDIFGVSLDDMMRSDMTGTENEEPTPDSPQPSAEEKDGYIAHMNRFSAQIALGVFLILFGVGACAGLSGAGNLLSGSRELFDVLGAIAVIVFVAIAVFLFIFAGIRHDSYRKQHTEIPVIYTEQQVRAFEKRFAITMASLIAGILIDVILLIIASYLIEAIYSAEPSYSDSANCFATAAFFVILASLVSGIVYCGIQHTKYHVEEYNKQNAEELHPSASQKLKEGICGAIMLTATAVFLLLGFIWGIWHPGWVVFPIGGILCAIVSTIFAARK